MSAMKTGIAQRAFNDAGTGANYDAGQSYEFDAGTFANYLAAGLIRRGQRETRNSPARKARPD